MQSPSLASPRPGASPGVANNAPPHVLLVCRDQGVAAAFQQALSQAPIQCVLHISGTPAEALAKLEQLRQVTKNPQGASIVFVHPAAVVTDTTLVQRLKRDYGTTVILLQGSPQTAAVFGADDFVGGPTPAEPLRAERLSILILKSMLRPGSASPAMSPRPSAPGTGVHTPQGTPRAPDSASNRMPNGTGGSVSSPTAASGSPMSSRNATMASHRPAPLQLQPSVGQPAPASPSKPSAAISELMQQLQTLKKKVEAKKAPAAPTPPRTAPNGTAAGSGQSSTVSSFNSARGTDAAAPPPGPIPGPAIVDSPSGSRSNSFVAPAPTPGRYRPRARSPLGGPSFTNESSPSDSPRNLSRMASKKEESTPENAAPAATAISTALEKLQQEEEQDDAKAAAGSGNVDEAVAPASASTAATTEADAAAGSKEQPSTSEATVSQEDLSLIDEDLLASAKAAKAQAAVSQATSPVPAPVPAAVTTPAATAASEAGVQTAPATADAVSQFPSPTSSPPPGAAPEPAPALDVVAASPVAELGTQTSPPRSAFPLEVAASPTAPEGATPEPAATVSEFATQTSPPRMASTPRAASPPPPATAEPPHASSPPPPAAESPPRAASPPDVAQAPVSSPPRAASPGPLAAAEPAAQSTQRPDSPPPPAPAASSPPRAPPDQQLATPATEAATPVLAARPPSPPREPSPPRSSSPVTLPPGMHVISSPPHGYPNDNVFVNEEALELPLSVSDPIMSPRMDIVLTAPVVPESELHAPVPVHVHVGSRSGSTSGITPVQPAAAESMPVPHMEVSASATSSPARALTPRRAARILLASHAIQITREDF